MTRQRIAFIGIGLATSLGLMTAVALTAAHAADAVSLSMMGLPSLTPDQWYAYVCGNDGAVFKFLETYLMYPAFGMVGAVILSNSQRVVAWAHALPGGAAVLNLISGNWALALRAASARMAAGPAAPAPLQAVKSLLLLIGLGFSLAGLLVACASLPAPITKPTGNASADVTAWLGEVGADIADANAKAAAAAGNAGAALVTAGKAACGAASELDGLYNKPLTQIGGTVLAMALGDPAAMAAADATESLTFKGVVVPDCLIVDAMDSGAPAADGIIAAQAVIAAVPALQKGLAQAAPAVAAQLVTAAPQTGTPQPTASSS